MEAKQSHKDLYFLNNGKFCEFSHQWIFNIKSEMEISCIPLLENSSWYRKLCNFKKWIFWKLFSSCSYSANYFQI